MNADPIEVAMLANMVRSNGHQLGPLIIGVDPGISGALVLLDPATMRVWKWSDMPTAESNGKRTVSATLLALALALLVVVALPAVKKKREEAFVEE